MSKAVLAEIENIALGSFSPLESFPIKKEFNSILESWHLTNGILFPIPPLFPVNKEVAKRIAIEKEIIITFENKPVAVIDVEEIFAFDKEKFIENVLKTKNQEHPGVQYVLGIGEFLVAGKASLLGQPILFGNTAWTPAEMRTEIQNRGWQTIVAFSTTNVPHRAHEYLQRQALEMADGLLIHALDVIGKKEGPKYPHQLITESYFALIDNYYPQKKVVFTMLPYLVRSAGPRSSILQAIIRQNFGCTHQIFGRDHEGFSHCYGEFESQEIFSKFPELKIKPIFSKGPYYCQKCVQIVTEDCCRHGSAREEISGTKVRALLGSNKELPEHYLRPEVKAVLEEFKPS